MGSSVSNRIPEVTEHSSCSVADLALEKKAAQSVSNMIPKETVSLQDLARRMQDLERHCEQALGALRDATAKSLSSQQTPEAPEQHASVFPLICPILGQLPRAS